MEESFCAFVTLLLSPNQSNPVPVKPRFHDSSFQSKCCKTLLKMDVSSPFAQTLPSVFYLCSADFVVILPDVRN